MPENDIIKVDILYLTHNRIASTKLTLPRLLNSTTYPFDLTIVDNASSDGTPDYLREVAERHEFSAKINLICHDTNHGLAKPTNEFWRKSQADLVGKIDNDILVENGWLETLVKAHEKISNLAVVGGFHFPKKVFNYQKCKHNIFSYSGVHILRQPHIGGNYIAKKEILDKNGFLDESAITIKMGGWTKYQHKLTKQDFIIGYYFPLIFFTHIINFSNDYYKKVRGMSRRKYIKWEIKDGKRLLNSRYEW